MRIGIAINKAWNVYNFRRGVIHALQDKGHQVIAIAPEDSYVPKVKEFGCEYLSFPLSDTGSNPFSELIAIHRLYRAIKSAKLDVLLTYTIKMNLYGSIAARWAGVPVICNVSGLGTAFLADTFSAKMARKLSAFSLKYADHIFFQNDDDQRDFLDETRLDRISTSVIPGSGIDLKEFAYERVALPATYQFIMLSRLIVEKGVVEYAEAARIVKKAFPNANFLLVGAFDSNHSRSIDKTMLEEWQNEDVLTYLTHSDNIQELIKQSEVVVLPSYREGTPRTLLEGGALGRPLIATDVPGCREVVNHEGNGLLCRVQDSNDLARHCIHYLEMNDKEKISMGEHSRKLVERKFDEKKVVDAYLDKIDALT